MNRAMKIFIMNNVSLKLILKFQIVLKSYSNKFNFYNGDYEKINETISDIEWDLILNNNNVKENVNFFYSKKM